MSANERIHPRNVHEILNRHILTDGYDIVLDLPASTRRQASLRDHMLADIQEIERIRGVRSVERARP